VITTSAEKITPQCRGEARGSFARDYSNWSLQAYWNYIEFDLPTRIPNGAPATLSPSSTEYSARTNFLHGLPPSIGAHRSLGKSSERGWSRWRRERWKTWEEKEKGGEGGKTGEREEGGGSVTRARQPGYRPGVCSMSRDKPVDDPWTRFDRVRWLLFHRLLRAGNFKFDYKLPAFPSSPRVSVSPCPPTAPSFARAPPFLARARPDEKLSSPDCDGIIGRPTLFMAFIFLKIAILVARSAVPFLSFFFFFSLSLRVLFSFPWLLDYSSLDSPLWLIVLPIFVCPINNRADSYAYFF